MAESRQRSAWEQTSTTLALLANIHRDEKKRSSPFMPDEFNPFAVAKQQPEKKLPGNIEMLKMFLPNQAHHNQ
jgi:hypothetical protein